MNFYSHESMRLAVSAIVRKHNHAIDLYVTSPTVREYSGSIVSQNIVRSLFPSSVMISKIDRLILYSTDFYRREEL